MSVKVKVPVPLQRLTEGKEEVEGEKGTIIALIEGLDQKYPGLAERISEGGKLRRFVNVYVNEEDVRFLNNEATSVDDGDVVSIVPAIAGG
jgi:molybdopterin synthase sulfur carrier subunit